MFCTEGHILQLLLICGMYFKHKNDFSGKQSDKKLTRCLKTDPKNN